MECEICGDPFTVHVTHVDEHGVKQHRSLCIAHAMEAGFPASDIGAVEEKLPILRQIVGFMKLHGRMPSHQELDIEVAGRIPPAQAGSKDSDRQIAFFERLLDFVETHGRFPTEEELPDPFLSSDDSLVDSWE